MKFILLLFLTVVLCAQKAPKAAPPEWVLTFADEFEGRELDLAKWVPHDAFSQGQATVSVTGGMLHLGPGVLTTYGVFGQVFGRFEIRCRITGRGKERTLFRLLPVPLAVLPEIDVFEWSAGDPLKALFVNKWGTEQTTRSYGDSVAGPDLGADFHVLAIEWTRNGISWFVDGKEKFRSAEGVPDREMYLMLESGAMDVDYIRVYRHI